MIDCKQLLRYSDSLLSRIILLLIIISGLSACGTSQIDFSNVDTTNLSQLESVCVRSVTGHYGPVVLTNMRASMLRESGMSIGAQGGLAWASDKMNVRMREDSKYLDTIFNFSGMMLSHGVIPPVLEEGDFTLNLADPDTIRVSDRTYRIVKQARFSTTPPNWREYLWLPYGKPELPDKSLLPRNKCELEVWRDSVRKGWAKGIQQAYNIFQQSLASLKRDYKGMLLYRKLLQQKMINPPFVSRTELGITGNGDDMRINDQVLRIVEHPQLQTNSRNWRAIVVKR